MEGGSLRSSQTKEQFLQCGFIFSKSSVNQLLSTIQYSCSLNMFFNFLDSFFKFPDRSVFALKFPVRAIIQPIFPESGPFSAPHILQPRPLQTFFGLVRINKLTTLIRVGPFPRKLALVFSVFSQPPICPNPLNIIGDNFRRPSDIISGTWNPLSFQTSLTFNFGYT